MSDDSLQQRCYPDNPTPTTVSTIYSILAVIATLIVSIIGCIAGYKKAKAKKLAKMAQKQTQLQSGQKHKQQENLKSTTTISHNTDHDTLQNTKLTLTTGHLHKHLPSDTTNDVSSVDFIANGDSGTTIEQEQTDIIVKTTTGHLNSLQEKRKEFGDCQAN